MADDPTSTSASHHDKKSKKHKKEKRHKRHREADDVEGSERLHKKSKSHDNAPNIAPETPIEIVAHLPEFPVPESEVNGHGSKTEKKKRRKHEREAKHKTEGDQTAHDGIIDGTPPSKEKKKKSKDRKQKHDKVEEIIPDSQPKTADQETVPGPDFMDIDSPPVETRGSEEFGQKPADKSYPFFSQTISQYLPLFPSGLIEPVEGYADQHLRPLLNRYVPSFRGVLLAYRNPRLGEAPGKGALTEESTMEDAVLLESINEYAVSYGWLTADVDLFRPTRGAWMEGIVNLHGEGHIGVVCWDMFNASIEAGRLPHGWRWVDLLSPAKPKPTPKPTPKSKENDREKTAEEAKLPTPDPFDDSDEDNSQMHTTGYWVDDNGTRIRGGSKVYFRIKHYEVGVSGDYGYISIQGTMLNEEDEKAKYASEMEVLRRRRLRQGGGSRKHYKRLPEFSMTKFMVNEAEDNEAQRAPVKWVSSRPGSDTE
ncbi:hypothetical protein F4804DRAFT_294148 [Jackrogersella minutella]|nr:hypothetical protein F4804DRAFT_294148 [Jackrogersella minutella]